MRFNRIQPTICGAAALALGVLLMICGPASKAQSHGSLIFEDTFSGPLNRTVWNQYITDNPANGQPWNIQNGLENPSSSEGRPNGFAADYDLPSEIQSGVPDAGLVLGGKQGSAAAGYSWTGAVICSYPNAHYGNTTGFTFDDAYVEVRAKMPDDLQCGGWPAIWFLAAPGSSGKEIDLLEGGFTKGNVNLAHIMATTLQNYPIDGRISQVLTDTGVNLSGGYHTYALAYKSGKYIKCYFDGKLVASWTKNVWKGSYYIIINNSMASSGTKGWHSLMDSTTPRSTKMLVKYVRAYRLD
jgi:hypothetical protein